MANKRRGYYSLNIGGRKRDLHFSMNFWSAFTDEMNISLDRLGEVFENGVSISSIRAIIYCGLLAYDQEEGNEIDYNIYKVGSWLEDVDSSELEKIVTAMTESRILGNDLNMGIERNPDPEKKTQSQ
jgi:hypothetical protein